MSFKLNSRWLLGAAVVAVLSLAAAGSAQAAFTPPLDKKCEGDSIIGGGASFQASAQQNAFAPHYITKTCKTKPFGTGHTITYNSIGSGAGRFLFGGNGALGVRSTTSRYIAYDEPPRVAEQAVMNAGDGVTGPGVLRTIPVATGSLTLAVNFPDGCAWPASTNFNPGKIAGADRFQISNTRIENAWQGTATKWGDLFGGLLTGTATNFGNIDCNLVPIKRVVRFDNSGTTFNFKHWLATITGGGTLGGAWLEPFQGGSFANSAWPNDAGGTAVFRGGSGAAAPVNCNPANPGSNGNGPALNCVNSQDGSIGYSDLSTARTKGFDVTPSTGDTTFWIPMTGNDGKVWDPTKDKKGYVTGVGKNGSSCAKATVNNQPPDFDADPKTKTINETLSNWSQVDVSTNPKGYSPCVLTYMGIWDDSADVYTPGGVPFAGDPFTAAQEEAQASTVLQYAKDIIGGGQATLLPNDYSGLPGKVKTISKNGLAGVDWNKP